PTSRTWRRPWATGRRHRSRWGCGGSWSGSASTTGTRPADRPSPDGVILIGLSYQWNAASGTGRPIRGGPATGYLIARGGYNAALYCRRYARDDAICPARHEGPAAGPQAAVREDRSRGEIGHREGVREPADGV